MRSDLVPDRPYILSCLSLLRLILGVDRLDGARAKRVGGIERIGRHDEGARS